tara:strand:- start:11921 stop:14197 length:2277 start_codon:yes stop_codon:yes gene_type:complete
MASDDEMRKDFASLVRRPGSNVRTGNNNDMPPADMGPASDLFRRAEQVSHALREPTHLTKGKKEYVAYVARVITNKSKTQQNYSPGGNNPEKGRKKDLFNVGTEMPNYHISVFIPDIHSALYGYILPSAANLLGLYEEALVRCIPENKEVTKTYGIPNVGDEIIIYYDPMEENSLATYRRKKASGIDLRPALDRYKHDRIPLTETNMRGAKFFSPLTVVEGYTPPESGQDLVIGDTKFVKKAPSSWLRSCAQKNNWAAYLINETRYSPKQKATVVEEGGTKIRQFYEPRVFTHPKAKEANASSENKLFGIVLSDGAPNLRLMWQQFEKQACSTHYGIDHNGRVHEFVEPTMVAYHSSAPSCPGNNLLTIGISTCQFGFKYEHAFNDNNIKNKLKPSFLNLIKGKNLFVGNSDYVGLPRNILAKTSLGIANDTYLLSSKEGMESCWMLTRCLSDKYDIPLESPAIVNYMRSNSKIPQFKDTSKTPYIYNFNDISTSIKGNILCGYDGLISYPGIRSRSWITAGRAHGAAALEYYMFCRMLNFTPDEAYYATLGTLILPGTVADSKITSSVFIDLQTYISKYGSLFATRSYVPNPLDGKQMLISAGKKVFNIADSFRKQLILENTHPAGTSPDADVINFGALAGYQIKDAWQQFLEEKENYLGISPTLEHCLYIVESARKKVFGEIQLLNKSISESKYSEYSTPFGKYVTSTAVNMFHTSAKHLAPAGTEPVTIKCSKNPEFENKFFAKYKISFKQILNL